MTDTCKLEKRLDETMMAFLETSKSEWLDVAVHDWKHVQKMDTSADREELFWFGFMDRLLDAVTDRAGRWSGGPNARNLCELMKRDVAIELLNEVRQPFRKRNYLKLVQTKAKNETEEA